MLPLTPKQSEIAALIALGKSNREIAIATGKTVGTVKVQLSAIYRKMQCRNRTELAVKVEGTP